MKHHLSKTQVQEKIDEFFKRKDFTPSEVKKIRRLAMKHKIKLGVLRKKFCKKCLSQLKGKTRLTNTHKTIICNSCNHNNKFRLS
jgi:RNase P subunit RPR2